MLTYIIDRYIDYNYVLVYINCIPLISALSCIFMIMKNKKNENCIYIFKIEIMLCSTALTNNSIFTITPYN